MRHLHHRLSVAILVIVALLGAAFYVIDRYSVRLYYDELSQRLNASLAMYVAQSAPLIDDGRVNRDALDELASRAMVINPTAEIYLLGPEGAVLGHGLPQDADVVASVDIEPVRRLLDDPDAAPVRGVDPRDPAAEKVFSAFPVTDAGRLAGYVYVVLGGSHYEAVANEVSGSDTQRVVGAAIALLALAGIGGGALLSAALTRRLRRLTQEVTDFTETEFSAPAPPAHDGDAGDEIDRLRDACHTMATTIRRQLASLEETDRLRRELVTNISHDLRTPLATMQGYIETLSLKDEQIDAATRHQYLEVAGRHAAHLGRLIQDLFDLSMLDSNRVDPAFETFSLTELIQDVVQEFELHAGEKAIRLRLDLPAEPAAVRADISLIQRVLENLVGNALKYTPEGGEVTIAVRASAGDVGVSVADTGPGIPLTEQPHIFDRFYKGNDSGNESMGLGLAIARRILELHGRRILVVSKERRGSRFEFDLPRAEAA